MIQDIIPERKFKFDVIRIKDSNSCNKGLKLIIMAVTWIRYIGLVWQLSFLFFNKNTQKKEKNMFDNKKIVFYFLFLRI